MAVDVDKLRASISEARPPFSLNKIGHVVLRVSDLARSTAFYTGVLGFRVSDIYGDDMCANSVLPPRDGIRTARRSEYFAGSALNDESECHSRLPIAKRRLRSSAPNGLLLPSRLDTSANVPGRRKSAAVRSVFPIVFSSGPSALVKAT